MGYNGSNEGHRMNIISSMFVEEINKGMQGRDREEWKDYDQFHSFTA